MTVQTTTIRPGLIVVLSTGITGNVKYNKTVIKPDTDTADGGQEAAWETQRKVLNAAEQKEATYLRSSIRSKITAICAQTRFGLLCPEDKADKLKEAVDGGRAVANEFNGRATVTRISLDVIAGRVAADDVEAVRAINGEVRSLLQAMETGLANLDVKAVREAADRAKSIGAMLAPDMGERVKEAVAIARKAATEIKKAAETSSAEIDMLAIRKITEARTSFLDLDGGTGEIGEALHETRTIDLAPIETEAAPAAPVATPQFEIG